MAGNVSSEKKDYHCHWIGLREHRQETMFFPTTCRGSCEFSPHPLTLSKCQVGFSQPLRLAEEVQDGRVPLPAADVVMAGDNPAVFGGHVGPLDHERQIGSPDYLELF